MRRGANVPAKRVEAKHCWFYAICYLVVSLFVVKLLI
jgi:hypothetical protein